MGGVGAHSWKAGTPGCDDVILFVLHDINRIIGRAIRPIR
jgi:hypothetical protein